MNPETTSAGQETIDQIRFIGSLVTLSNSSELSSPGEKESLPAMTAPMRGRPISWL